MNPNEQQPVRIFPTEERLRELEKAEVILELLKQKHAIKAEALQKAERAFLGEKDPTAWAWAEIDDLARDTYGDDCHDLVYMDRDKLNDILDEFLKKVKE